MGDRIESTALQFLLQPLAALSKEPTGSEELAQALVPYMNYCIEQFGPDRYMFWSNSPPDKGPYSYNVLFNAFKRLSHRYSATERAALFQGTAARLSRRPLAATGAYSNGDYITARDEKLDQCHIGSCSSLYL